MNLQFLLELQKPLGAAGNHALAGRYATMLKSAPGFDYSFAKASAIFVLFSHNDFVVEVLFREHKTLYSRRFLCYRDAV